MAVPRYRTGSSTRRQSGAHAVEFALIFPVFFALLYGTTAYGLIFSMRMGLQHAAEEGAREALRYQVPDSPTDTQISLRENAAFVVASAAASWMASMGALNVAVDVCPVGSDCLPVIDESLELADNIVCGQTLADACQVVVAVEYPYALHPIFPSIPGLGLMMPTSLQGRARALIDGRALSRL